MFQTEASWEILEGMNVLRALAGQPDLRQYRMFELSINMPIYRLDVVLPEKYSKDQVLRRFRLQTLSAALKFIKEANPVEVRLTQEPAFEDGKVDKLRTIEAVSQGVGSDGQPVYICDSVDGSFVVDMEENDYFGTTTICQLLWPRRRPY